MLHQSFSDSVRTISIDREALLTALREIAGQIYAVQDLFMTQLWQESEAL